MYMSCTGYQFLDFVKVWEKSMSSFYNRMAKVFVPKCLALVQYHTCMSSGLWTYDMICKLSKSQSHLTIGTEKLLCALGSTVQWCQHQRVHVQQRA